MAILQRLADENPDVTEFGNLLANSPPYPWQRAVRASGQARAAEVELLKALAIHQKLADWNPAVTIFRGNVALDRMFLGRLLLVTATPEAASQSWTALAITQRLADENPEDTVYGLQSGDGPQLSRRHAVAGRQAR